MNKTIALVFMLAASLVFQAQKTIETRISDVTVFLAGAQVTHNGEVTLKAGENIFRIDDLTAYLDPNSVQVEGNSDYTILSVRHQVNYETNNTSNPRIKAILDSLEDFRFKQSEIQSMKNVYAQERALLEANRNIKGADAVLVMEDLEEMANFFRERFKSIEYKLLELGDQEKKNNDVLNRLQNKLNALNARISTNPSEVLVTVIARKEGKSNLKLTYFAQNAGWVPSYDLRAEEINGPIDFSYRAKVYQSTGNDWNDVNLTLSTGNPAIGGQIPNLNPWYIYLYDPQPMSIYSRKDYAPAAAPAYSMGESDKIQADAEVYNGFQTAASYTTIQNAGVSTEFKISVPYDIPSDNQQYDVTMQHESLKAEYAYVTIPKMDNDAFLRANVIDWMQYSLLPGESNIYFKGTFVGKGYIDPALANDTLSLSLGRDKSINVKREQIKDFCKTSLFGSKQKTSKAYQISVTNTKKQAITIEIKDQLPISQNGDVTVETEELSGGTYDAATGLVTWKLTIQPGETVKKDLKFNVTYPKKKYIANL
ncbi:MAG: hypothetical protein RLZZ77_1745 [Bacteroidota bacterium]